MKDELRDWLDSPPSAVYLLVSTSNNVQEVGNEVIEQCDDRIGIQARVTTESLLENANTEDEALAHILREAKVGSRWGKDLLDYYREFVESMVNSVDEVVLEDELAAQFSKYDADPYESAFIGEPLSLGFDLDVELSDRLDRIESSGVAFNGTDFAAAVGHTVDSRGIDGPSVGTVLIEFRDPLSEATGSSRLSYLPRVVQEMLLIGFSVLMVGPDTGTDEAEQVEGFFRSVGRFDLRKIGSTGITVPEEVNSWLDSWYERLCYDVDSSKISQDVARTATAAAFDLKNLAPDEREYSTHFVDAIEYGLQDQYSEQKLGGAHRDRFDELWDDVVKTHPNYDQYRSKRKSFPRVSVARKDGEVREFVLHHEGALLELQLNGVPVDSDREPSAALIDSIKSFLDAQRVDEERWSALIRLIGDRLSDVTEVAPEEIGERLLLYQGFLPPENMAGTAPSNSHPPDRASSDFDAEWYREHWRAILSSHQVTSQAGLSLIKDKQELMEDLKSEEAATTALFAKLQRDVERAWQHYSDALVESIDAGVTDDVNLEASESRDKSSRTVEIRARNTRSGQEETVEVEVYMPYRDVRVDGRRVSRPTISNSAGEVLRTLKGVIGSPASDSINDVEDLLYDLVKLFGETRAGDDRSLVYFDDIVEFCLTIPGIPDLFRNSKLEPEEGLRQALGSSELKRRLERSGSTYHRKGTDPYTGVKVGSDRYVAVELQVRNL